MDQHNKELATAANPKELEPLSKLLGEEGVPFTISRDKSVFNPAFSFSDPEQRVRLCVSEADYTKAMEVLGLSHTPPLQAEMEYLEQFEVAELREILVEKEKWELNYQMAARKLLAEKGAPLDEAWLRTARRSYLDQMRKPKTVHWTLWVATIPLSLVGAPVAMAIAAFIYLGTGNDPQGDKYRLYAEGSRTLALLLILISAVSFLAGMRSMQSYFGIGGWFMELAPYDYFY